MKDVVSDGRTGLLVPPADAAALASALERAIGDAHLRRRLGTEAHAVASHRYTWDNAAATFSAAYQAARGNHG
jgi:glycosyltransferase involved in cell wall biosynthesis